MSSPRTAAPRAAARRRREIRPNLSSLLLFLAGLRLLSVHCDVVPYVCPREYGGLRVLNGRVVRVEKVSFVQV